MIGLATQAGMLTQFSSGGVAVGPLPFGNAERPRVWVDNDDNRDAYLSVLAQAAASSGRIILHGVSTTTSIAPYTSVVPESDANEFGTGRIDEYHKAILSGFHPTRCKLPSAVFKGHMTKPGSGLIADTTPLNMPSATTLLAETLAHCTPNDPMIVCLGGAHSIVADAYLQALAVSQAKADEFASKCVVSALAYALGSGDGYNEKVDAWASEITAEVFTTVLYPFTHFDDGPTPGHQAASPEVDLARVRAELPESWIRGSIYTRDHPTNELPGGYDIDGLVLCVVLDNWNPGGPNYVNNFARYSKSGSTTNPGSNGEPDKDVATYTPDASGNTWFITEVTQANGTTVWWDVMADPAAWTGGDPMEFDPSPYTDDFNRANSSTLGVGWEQIGTRGRHAVVSNTLGKASTNDGWDKRSESYTGDHFARAKLATDQGGTREPSIGVRFSGSGTATNCFVLYLKPTKFEVRVFDAGSQSNLLTIASPEPLGVTGEEFMIAVRDDVITVWRTESDTTHPMYRDGFRLFGVVRDDTVAGGKPGVACWIPSGTNVPIFDDWKSGEVF